MYCFLLQTDISKADQIYTVYRYNPLIVFIPWSNISLVTGCALFKGGLNCAAFGGGVVEAFLSATQFVSIVVLMTLLLSW